MKRRLVLVGLAISILALVTACLPAPAPAPTAPPEPTAVPILPTATAVAEPTAGPAPAPVRLNLDAGNPTAAESGAIPAGGLGQYVVALQAGQTIQAQVSAPQGQVVLVVYGADGAVLLSDHVGATSWQGQIPTTQDYYIDLKSTASAAINYTFQASLAAQPQPSPQPTVKRISFAAGATTAVEHGTVAAGGLDRYVLKAMAGQTMSVSATSYGGQVILVIWGADGTVLISDHAGTTHWSGTLPSTQDYYIDCKSVGSVDLAYTLQVTIPPQPGPQPTTKRIIFAAGSTTATEYGNAAPGTSARYVLKAMAGQTMNVSVSTSQGQAILVIWGADGTVLISDHAGATTWSGLLPSTQDYIISVQSVGSAAAAFALTVNIPPA